MNNMPDMLAYTIRGSFYPNSPPSIVVGQGKTKVQLNPSKPADDSYWIAVLDRNNPNAIAKDFIVPGQNNTAVPTGIDTYMCNPQYIFVIATQYLSLLHVPQGEFYDYLVKYGAGPALKRIEQLNSSLGCGSISRPNYILTGQGGPRGGNNLPPPTYELGSVHETMYITMSLMPMPNGKPPYSICDSFTFVTK